MQTLVEPPAPSFTVTPSDSWLLKGRGSKRFHVCDSLMPDTSLQVFTLLASSLICEDVLTLFYK